MFLSLGGSRRRAHVPGNAQLQGSSASLQDFNQGVLRSAPEDSLQALAAGKYASSRSSVTLPTSLVRSKSFGESSSPLVAVPAGCYNPEPVQVNFSTTSRSSKSTLSYYLPSPNLPSLARETSRVSSDSGITLHGVNGGEEAMSKDCTRLEQLGSRRSQTLDLAKKLKHSLGSKFADSLRETIKEVEMKQERVEGKYEGSNTWPALRKSLKDTATTSSGEVTQSESGTAGKPWDHGCWSVEKNNDTVTPPDHSSFLSFSAVESLTTLERSDSSLKSSFGGSAEDSKRLSWFSQENISQSAIAELSWGAGSISPAQLVSTPSISMDTEFMTSGHSDMSFSAIFKESGAKESWTDRSTTSRLPSSRSELTRRHVFPEAAAMETCRPDSVLQQSSPNFRPREETSFSRSKPSMSGLYNLIKKSNGIDQSFLDVPKGFKDCESLLEFWNTGHSSNRALQEEARQRLYENAAAKDSGESVSGWHENISTSYNGDPLLELPNCGALEVEPPSGERGVKRTRDDAYASVQLPKRQCTGSLLDVPAAIDEDGGVKSDPIAVGFEEYLANLAASAKVPSSELSGSPLASLLEDFGQDSIVPIHLAELKIVQTSCEVQAVSHQHPNLERTSEE